MGIKDISPSENTQKMRRHSPQHTKIHQEKTVIFKKMPTAGAGTGTGRVVNQMMFKKSEDGMLLGLMKLHIPAPRLYSQVEEDEDNWHQFQR